MSLVYDALQKTDLEDRFQLQPGSTVPRCENREQGITEEVNRDLRSHEGEAEMLEPVGVRSESGLRDRGTFVNLGAIFVLLFLVYFVLNVIADIFSLIR